MFRATMCPSSGEITVSLRHCLARMVPCVPDSHLHRGANTKCRIDTVISPDDGHIVVRNMYRKEISILRKVVHQVGFIYNDARSTEHKASIQVLQNYDRKTSIIADELRLRQFSRVSHEHKPEYAVPVRRMIGLSCEM